jgi:hypothetical protein
MQRVNLCRETGISRIISTLTYPQIAEIWPNLCNLWISLYTAKQCPGEPQTSRLLSRPA